MADLHMRHILFLCTGNSARSIMAESILNRVGAGRFRGHSAGSFPTGRVNPHALYLLRRLNYPTGDLRSKSWDEFAQPGASTLDFILPSATTPPARSARSGPASP